jgi:class 3 adenylate cyclase
LNSLLGFLEANEPFISAAVGLLTLAAAVFGAFKLALLPLLASLRAGTGGGAAASGRFRLWASLVDRGLDPRADLIEQVSLRTFNGCAMLIITATLLWLVITLLTGDILILCVVNFAAFLLAITAYNLQAAGFADSARWLLIVDCAFYWASNIAVMGTMIGLEYFLGGLLILPLLLFGREKPSQLYAALVFLALTFPGALLLEGTLDYTLPPAYAGITTSYYYVNAVVLAALVVLLISSYNGSADESFRELEDQKQKSDELIHSVLPAYIAEKMAADEANVADWHSEASVLFATVHGFDSLYQRVSAVQLVEILSQLFGEFDDLVAREGVEKINTLGTNYVAATGIDPTRATDHAGLARVALGMREIVERLSRTAEHPFSLSAGLSTGDVVSGVIGASRPTFDIWGKTVELANALRDRKLSSALVVNEAAYWRLRGTFDFEACGPAGESRRCLLREKPGAA